MVKQRGFTIVELIMVIVILGIISAVAAPRFFDRKVFDERFYFEEVLSTVRYGQKLAVASGCPIGFQVNDSGYALNYSGGDCGVMPVGNGYNKSLPAGVSVSRALAISFNSLGSVNEACPGGRCVATIGSHTFIVHAATGFIEAGQ
ncbi:type II secretion system GspH family protein [Pseudomonas sp. S5(2021)]|nr:type II secretion system GspH family protein [Pseudomonas sp. S5(2021)]